MKYIKALAFLCFGFFAFAYGMAVRHYEIPPHGILQSVFRTINPEPTPELAGFKIDPTEISEALSQISASSASVRDRLKQPVILPPEMVQLSVKEISETKRELTAKIYGIPITAELNKTKGQDAKCLRIYIQGHGGHPFNYDYHNEILKSSNDEGCDFLSMSMLGKGQNTGPVSFPAGKYDSEEIFLPWEAAARHGNYLFYNDKDLPEMDPLALFLTPHYYIIQSIIDDYQDTAIMGISGGGWYVVWLAALIDKIDTSIVYAGSLPMVYRTSVHFFADYEEVSSNLYREFNYWELYYLGSIRDSGPQDRKYYFVFNDKDDCCFMDPAASHFQKLSREIYPENVFVTVDKSNQHTMNVDLILRILNEASSTS